MKVICVNKNRFSKDELTIGKIYEILSHTEHVDITVQWFIADDGTELLYFDNDKDFITLEQYREQQLNKILI
jgi:hypothetical protein